MDKGKMVNNLYLVNGSLHESIGTREISNKNNNYNSNPNILEKMRVIFRDDPNKYKV